MKATLFETFDCSSYTIFYISFRHTKEMIQKLESAGLGYHVSADQTGDKLGMIFFTNQIMILILNIICIY